MINIHRCMTLSVMILLGILLLQFGRDDGHPWAAGPDKPDQAAIQEEVEAVFREALSTHEFTDADGKRLTVRPAPTEWALKSLRHLGDEAVPFIASHLRSADPHERELSVFLLGNQGGTRIIEFLRPVLRDAIPSVRLAAVHALEAVPRQLAKSLLEEAAKIDPDPSVREAARKILGSRTE